MKDYLIDTHAHLDMLSEVDISGVGKVVVPSVDVENMEKVVSMSEIPQVYSMIGIYPTEARNYDINVEEKMIQLERNKLQNPKVISFNRNNFG